MESVRFSGVLNVGCERDKTGSPSEKWQVVPLTVIRRVDDC